MSEPSDAVQEPEGWYSIPEAAAKIGVRDRDVRGMLRDHRLLAVRRGPNAALAIPAELLLGAEEENDGPGPLPNLRGTLTLLADAGYGDEEAFRWLFTPDEEIGDTPIAALRAGRTRAVRRVAQALGF